MHSRVFQLSTCEIDELDYLSEVDSGLEDNFIGPIADYVSSECNREEDIRFLLELYGKHGIEHNKDEYGGHSLVFSESFKENYFKERFDSVSDLLSNMTLGQFSADSCSINRVINVFEDKFGFYVYFDTPEPFDVFVRELIPGTRYYIGGTVDYHY